MTLLAALLLHQTAKDIEESKGELDLNGWFPGAMVYYTTWIAYHQIKDTIKDGDKFAKYKIKGD